MSRRIFTVVPIVFAFVVGGSLAGAQTSFEPPRLADGHVDLQRVWDFRTLTPLQRPEDLADKSLLTAEETAEIESEAVARTGRAQRPKRVAYRAVVGRRRRRRLQQLLGGPGRESG